MESIVNSDFFLLVLGMSQIFIAVFLVFLLGLMVKIFSDISYIVGRVKKETDEVVEDISFIRKEAKSIVRSTSAYLKVFVSASGIKKAIGLLSRFMDKKAEPKRTKKATNKKTKKD